MNQVTRGFLLSQDCDFAGASSGSWAALGALLATQGAGSVEALFHSGAEDPGDPGEHRGTLGKTKETRGKTNEFWEINAKNVQKLGKFVEIPGKKGKKTCREILKKIKILRG